MRGHANAMVAIDSARAIRFFMRRLACILRRDSASSAVLCYLDPDGDDNPRLRRHESGAVYRNDAAAEYRGRWSPNAMVAIDSARAIRFFMRRLACILRRDSASSAVPDPVRYHLYRSGGVEVYDYAPREE
jgi:hypothetical protein